MLVMRRRKGESILIGEDVEIHIISIGRTKVKIGINAPKNIPVLMREVELVQKENQAAALSFSETPLEGALEQILGKRPVRIARGDEKNQ